MTRKYMKKALALILSIIMILSSMMTLFSVFAFAKDDEQVAPQGEWSDETFKNAITSAVADNPTNMNDIFRDADGKINPANDGMIWADKSVFYQSNPVQAVTNALGGFDDGEFSVALSAMAQGYPSTEDGITVDRKVHADVVFVIDVSGSMGRYNMAGSTMTREEGTVLALNSAINKLMEADPETRIGLVCFGTEYYPNGLYLPLDKYTLPAGDTDYVTYAKTKVMGTAQRPDGDIISVALAPSKGVTYANAQGKVLQDDDTEFEGTLRLKISADNKLTIIREDNMPYFGGDANNERIPGINSNGEFTIANNSFITFERINENQGVTYGIFRSNNAYYLYGNLKTEQQTVHNTVEHKKVVNSISTSSSRKTAITLDNGVTFYVYRSGTTNNNSIYVSTSSSSYAQAIATLTSTRKTGTYKPTGSSITYTFTRDSSSQITVSYSTTTESTETVFKTTDITVPVDKSGASKLFATSGCLMNSKGQRMAVTSYTVDNDGTYTQAGLKAAESMFKSQGSAVDTARTPVIVLVSDGTPTFYKTDYKKLSGTKQGNGNVNNCNDTMGYYTIKTAIDVKDEVKKFYDNNANTLFYSIGPGVDYLFGQTVLDPKPDNLSQCKNNTTTNTQSGTGTPKGLYTLLNNDKSLNLTNPDGLNYVDFSDYSWYGNMSIAELDDAFSKVVSTIFSATTPMSSTPHTDGESYHASDYMRFYDTIGEGMEIVGDPVVCLDNSTAIPTVLKTISIDGVKYNVVNNKFTINGVQYDATEDLKNFSGKSIVKGYGFGGEKYKDFIVEIIITPEGKQTIRGEIPGDLVPAFMPREDENGNIRYITDGIFPAVLNFKVALTEESKQKSGTYYTNSVINVSNSKFCPSIGNPYYYDPVVGEEKKVEWAYEGQMNEDLKSVNKTGTIPQVSYSTVTPESGEVFVGLGNNGKIVLDYSQINLIKIWDDGNNANRPNEITLKIDKYVNGVLEAEVAERTVKKQDCKVTNVRGKEHWEFTVDGLTLPGGDGVEYRVTETTNDSTYEVQEGVLSPIPGTNDYQLELTNVFSTALISFQIYLVNQNGQPIDENGNVVSFENRVIKMTNITSYSDAETEPFADDPIKEVTFDIALNSETYFDYENLDFFIPEGYFFYNHETTFTEIYNGDTVGYNSSVVINDNRSVLTTKLYDENNNELPKDSNGKYIIDNYHHIRVAFAIVKMDIIPDVVVLDYGKPIECSPIENDGVDTSKYHISGLTETEYTFTEEGEVELKNSIKLKNGVVTIKDDNTVVYSPFRYMSSIDEVTYYIEENESTENCRHLYSTITFIPATMVYYEDNFGGSDENGGLYINYTGNWYTVDDEGKTTAGTTANTDSTDIQDRGEVGQGHIPYGYDSSYEDCEYFSNGSAAKVTGTVTNGVSDATARFTFTGTGFDIISRTDLDCGMIGVDVYYPGTTDLVTRIPVINKGVGTLYQIPVISCEGLPYGTYDVEISVKAPLPILGVNGSNFYLDAIRIYNPMGLCEEDNENFNEANNAYREDCEADAVVKSVRDIILQADELLDTETLDSAVYVDTLTYEYEGGAILGNKRNPDQPSADFRQSLIDASAIKKFQIIGPNEEVYLSPGCGVGFVIEADEIPKSVQLAMKVPKPQNSGSKLTIGTYGNNGSTTEMTIKSATEMYYDISDSVVFTKVGEKYRATVILSNAQTFNNEDDIVSITNVKLTYDKPVELVENAKAPKQNAEPVMVSFLASTDTLRQAFDTVYVQCAANTPNYDVVNTVSTDEVYDGHEIEARFNTSKFVDEIEIIDENGKSVKIESLDSELDKELVYSDDFLNSKQWKVVFRAEGEGEHVFTVKAVDGEGRTEEIRTTVLPVEIVSVSVKQLPEKTVYKPGEIIDTTGMVLEVVYSDGTVKEVDSGFVLANDEASKSSDSVTVSYEGNEAEFNIQIKQSFFDKLISLLVKILRFFKIMK